MDPDIIAAIDAQIAQLQTFVDAGEALSTTQRTNLGLILDAIKTRQAQAGALQVLITSLEGKRTAQARRMIIKLQQLKAAFS